MRALRPGEDLALSLADVHGVDAPEGVLAHDHLDIDARRWVDRLALDAVARWREAHDDRLTAAGVCLPWIWEWELFEAFGPAIAQALGLRGAIERYDPAVLELGDRDQDAERIVRAVAAVTGTPVTHGRERRELPGSDPGRQPPRARRVRQRLLRAATAAGAPSLLRRDCVVLDSYWPLMPALDRMLEERRLRPAIRLQKLPTGPRRSLRAALRGGFVGMPSRTDRRQADADAARLLATALGTVPKLDVADVPLGPALHARAIELIRRRTAADLADARMLRRAFGHGRVSRLVGTYDIEPSSRLVIALAQEAGVPTSVLLHGVYILPQPMPDMQVCDEIMLWSETAGPPSLPAGRPVHIVGYPLEHRRPATKLLPPASDSPRVVVLAQSWVPSTAMIDSRITMRHYETAAAAVLETCPNATVVLRPHPSHDLAPVEALMERWGADRIVRESEGDILDVLSKADLCIGAATTATLQAALVGTPVAVLNLTGYEWPWPLGGATSVPIARSAGDLVALLDRFMSERTLAGASDLLAGLGVDGGDTTERVLEILEGTPSRAPSARQPGFSTS